MPKQISTINDFSGGFKNAVDARDMVGNELAECTNLDPSGKGLLTTVSIFSTSAIAATATALALQPGYGLFIFNNDWKISDPDAEYTHGEYIVKSQGAADGDLDIYESGLGWHSGLLSPYAAAKPCFYSAEGDLFVGGSNAADSLTQPYSLRHHQQTRFKTSAGVDSQAGWAENDVANFLPDLQRKLPPAGIGTGTADMDITQVEYANNSGAPTPAATRLHWLISPSTEVESGTWNNTAGGADGAGDYYEFYTSFLYKNKTESKTVFLGQLGGASVDITGAATIENKGLLVAGWFGTDPLAFGKAVAENVYGARLYVRLNKEPDYYLLAELD